MAASKVLVSGGSWIFLETSRDAATGDVAEVAVWERDTLVHEVGHAVADDGLHPVTGLNALHMELELGDTSEDNILVTHLDASRYLPHFIARIRNADRPRPVG